MRALCSKIVDELLTVKFCTKLWTSTRSVTTKITVELRFSKAYKERSRGKNHKSCSEAALNSNKISDEGKTLSLEYVVLGYVCLSLRKEARRVRARAAERSIDELKAGIGDFYDESSELWESM